MTQKHMHLKHLARLVAADTGRPISVCHEILQAGFDGLAKLLAGGESLNVSNFGTFETKERPETKAQNIQTRQTVNVPKMQVVKFRPTGRLRIMVRNGDTNATISKGR